MRTIKMQHRARWALQRMAAAGVLGWLALLASMPGTAAVPAVSVTAGGKIAYALVGLHWATYQSADGKTECPDGYNEGPREQFKRLFPDDGTARTLLETELSREIQGW